MMIIQHILDSDIILAQIGDTQRTFIVIPPESLRAEPTGTIFVPQIATCTKIICEAFPYFPLQVHRSTKCILSRLVVIIIQPTEYSDPLLHTVRTTQRRVVGGILKRLGSNSGYRYRSLCSTVGIATRHHIVLFQRPA